MASLSSFFVLSPRGDTIIKKEYRFSLGQSGAEKDLKSSVEMFFRKVKFWDTSKDGGWDGPDEARAEADESENFDMPKVDAPPVFLLDGESFLHIKRSGLIFGCATRYNVSPSQTLELLAKIAKIFKDYCGTLSEEAIRKNFILLYELLDEMLDYGYPQVTSTEQLKMFVYNEPIVTTPIVTEKTKGSNSKTASAASVHKPVSVGGVSSGKSGKNEIFVDILERLNVLFSANGYVLNSSIDGCIQMKSYLSGNPELRLALNEDLVVGKGNGQSYGAVVLDDLNFHDCVNLSEFDGSRTLSFYAPDGEFVLLNYRIASEFRVPFKIMPAIEMVTPTKLEIMLTVRNEIPAENYGANVVCRIPLPRATATVFCEMLGAAAGVEQTAEHLASERVVEWKVKKFSGASELSMKIKLSLDSPSNLQTRKEIGPISLSFEIPMFNVSNLQVRYLRIAETSPSPFRWVRYVTQSSSYVCRL